MRVGIVGDEKRAAAWENHLRPLKVVSEVIISSSLTNMEDVQAAILIDDSADNLHQLSRAIRLGIHSYLISKLPTDEAQLQKIHSLSQESGVRVQFSHWPTLSPASHWMKQHVPKPAFIQIIKEQSHPGYSENRRAFTRHWMDEIGWIIKWMDMGTHRIEAQKLLAGNADAGIRIYIRFENGATASLFFQTAGTDDNHRRLASGSNLLLDCNVIRQSVKKIHIGKSRNLTVESLEFDASGSAALSAMHFFKAIQLKKMSSFTPHDALRTASTIGKITRLLDSGP